MSGYNYESFGQCDIDAPDFWAVATIGPKAPDFNLADSTAIWILVVVPASSSVVGVRQLS